MIDTARNFKPKEWILTILDVMALYKLNTLHLHLTDDESWRLEIPGIPELTEVVIYPLSAIKREDYIYVFKKFKNSVDQAVYLELTYRANGVESSESAHFRSFIWIYAA